MRRERMDYYRIADNNISVLWEDEAGKNEFYDRLGISFHPVFLGLMSKVIRKGKISKSMICR